MDLCIAFRSRLFVFLCACLSGILFALVWRKYEQTVQFSSIRNHYSYELRRPNYEEWLHKQNLSKFDLSGEILRYSKNDKTLLESSYLFRSVPILCLLFVNSYHGAEAVKHTWGQHCNIILYFGRFIDNKIPVMKIPPITSFEGFCYAFTHTFKKYSDLFEWVLIADDYTYAIIENLRYYVAPLNSSHPYYLGHPIKDFTYLYNVGSAGIVLSKGSMLILNSLYSSERDCITVKPPSWYFDQSIGKILRTFNVHPVDTRDELMRGRFNPFSAETMIIPGSISVFSSYWRTSAFLSKEGLNCCSDNAITFHGLLPSKMYLMEYLQYHLVVLRNSLKGIGNNPPQGKEHDLDKASNEIENIGEPFVQLVDKDWVRSSKRQKKTKLPSKNIWDEIFGS